MNLVVRNAHRTLLVEVEPRPDAVDDGEAEVLAERFLHDVGVAFPRARRRGERCSRPR